MRLLWSHVTMLSLLFVTLGLASCATYPVDPPMNQILAACDHIRPRDERWDACMAQRTAEWRKQQDSTFQDLIREGRIGGTMGL